MLLQLLLVLLFSCLGTRGLPCPQLPTGCICTTISAGKLSVQCFMVPLAEVTAALYTSGASASVEVLTIEEANDTTLEKNFTQYYPSLCLLRLRFGMLHTIEAGAFANASQLSTLDLRGNSLTMLSGAMLDGIAPGLNQLSLDQNSLQYLLSDLQPLFTSITGSISLAGNSIICSCHIQWLVDLLHSTNTTLPTVTGASCMENGSSVSRQLIDPTLNLTYCPDLCANEVYTCPLNLTCMRKQENESYFCAETVSPTVLLSSSHTLEMVSTTNNYYVTSSHAPSTTPMSPSPTLTSLMSPSPTPSPLPLLSVPALQTLLTNAQSGGSAEQAVFIEQLHSVVSSGDVMTDEIPVLVNLIASAAQLVISNPNAADVETILTTVSDFLDLSQLAKISEPSATILDLFQIVDSLGKVIPIIGSSVTIAAPNIALLVAVPSPNTTSWNISSTLLLEDQEGETNVYIPASIIEDALRGQSASGCDVRLLASLWAVNTTLLEVVNNTTEPPIILANGVCDWSIPSQQMNATVEVNSILVSISLVHSPNCSLNTTNFTEPILIRLHHINSSYTQPSCGVLDEMEESGQEWIRSACTLVGDEANYTVCACNHLTTFGLLMNPTEVVTASVPLQIATKVGLSISILCLLATIFLLFALKLESKLHHIHRQLALALCLLQVLFLVGVDRRAVPTPDALCTLIAALIHYLLLCTFAWQLIEGVHLYVYIVKVFYNEKIVWAYYPFAWGTPLIIVAITLGVRFCDYGSLNYCWITQGNGANWAFHGPVIAVVTINIILLVMVMVTIIRAVHNKDPQRCFFCTLLQASIVLLPCLGINWVLGFLVVLSDDPLYREIVEYVVLVFITLQGLAIFLVHCVLNTEVRAAFLKAVGCREMAKKQKSLFSYKTNSAVLSGWKRRLSSSLQGRRSSLDSVSNDNNLPLSMRESKSYTLQLNTVLEDMDDDIFAVRSASTPNLTSKGSDTVNQS